MPLVHRVYFIVHVGESHAKPLMFSKTLSTMDDVEGRVEGKRERARELGSEGTSSRGGVVETNAASGTPYLRNVSFFLSLRTRGKFSSPLRRRPSLSFSHVTLLSSACSSSYVSVFFPPGSPSNFIPFDLSNSRNCYSVTDQLSVAAKISTFNFSRWPRSRYVAIS